MYIKPKKRLGQNFLTDRNILRKICEACKFGLSDTVLEIGAGRGELTELISARVYKVYAIEIDSDLCHILEDRLKGYHNVKIINKDILKFDIRRYLGKLKVKVVGNIPYYISSPIIERLIKYRENIESIFITIQKEFAKRIVAIPGSKEYGAFSCFVQYYTEPKIIINIKNTCFFPSPKVDSSLLRLKIRPMPLVKPKDEYLFFRIIRAAFNKRRKTLRNSLEGIIASEKLNVFFDKYSIDSKTRPESLSLEDFKNLTNI